jgi:hypothetical protein
MSKFVWSLVTDGVFLYTKKTVDSNNNVIIDYEIESSLLQLLHFELNISQSQNFCIQNSTSDSVQITVQPYERCTVAQLNTIDKSKRAVLKMQYKWKIIDFDTSSSTDANHISGDKNIRVRDAYVMVSLHLFCVYSTHL